jgi:hypothetical protein
MIRISGCSEAHLKPGDIEARSTEPLANLAENLRRARERLGFKLGLRQFINDLFREGKLVASALDVHENSLSLVI